jgi:hypothetical protein
MKESHHTVRSSRNVSTLDMVIWASQWMRQLCRSTRRSVGSSQVKLGSIVLVRLGSLAYACGDINELLIVLRQEFIDIIASSFVFC